MKSTSAIKSSPLESHYKTYCVVAASVQESKGVLMGNEITFFPPLNFFVVNFKVFVQQDSLSGM